MHKTSPSCVVFHTHPNQPIDETGSYSGLGLVRVKEDGAEFMRGLEYVVDSEEQLGLLEQNGTLEVDWTIDVDRDPEDVWSTTNVPTFVQFYANFGRYCPALKAVHFTYPTLMGEGTPYGGASEPWNMSSIW